MTVWCGFMATLLMLTSSCFGPAERQAFPLGAIRDNALQMGMVASSAPATLSQRREPSLPEPREETAAAALQGRLYVLGGYNVGGHDTATVFIFNGQRWTAGPPLPLALDHPSAAVLNGRLYLAGGYSSGMASDLAFTLSRGSWVPAGRLQHARGALALVNAGGRMYALGGRGSDGREVSAVEVYQPGSGRWRTVTNLPAPRDHLAGFSYRGWACVAGGRTPNTARVDCYDPGHRSWRRLPDLPVPTSGAGGVTYGGEVVVGGGELPTEGGHIITQLARLRGDRWSEERMLVPRHGLQFAVFKGRIWACGGGIQPGLHAVATCTSMG